MEQEIRGKTRSSLFWSLGTKIPYQIFRFGISIIIARILNPKDFGIVSIATMVILYSNSFTNLGFNQALVQKKLLKNKHIDSILVIDLAFSLFMTFVFYVTAPTIASFFNSPECKNVIRVLSSLFIITTFHDLPYALFRRNLNFKTISIVDTIKEIFISLITLLIALLGYGYWSIVWGRLIPLIFATVYLFCKMERKPRIQYHHQSVREIFDFAVWSVVKSQIAYFSSRVDRLIIAKFLGPEPLGFYDKAKGFSQMPSDTISMSINSVLFSSFSRSQNNIKQLENILKKAIFLISLINFPIYLGLYAVAPYFVLGLLGEKWNQMIIPLQILSVACLFSTCNGLIATFNVATGNYKKHTIRLFICVVFLFFETLYWVSICKEAVAFGLLLFFVLLFFLGIDLVKEEIKISWMEIAICFSLPLISSICMMVIVRFCSIVFLTNVNILNLILLTIIGAITYIIIIAFFKNTIKNYLN